MNDRKDIEKVQLALDITFSNLKDDPWLAQKVLANAKGKTKMKKKLSIGMVLVIVLILVTITALAVVTLTNYFVDYAHLEATYGSYCDWPDEAKIHLVETMRANGLKLDTAKLEEFNASGIGDVKRAQIATDIVCLYYGETGYMSTYNIMEHELGAFGSAEWTAEDKALYSQITKELGIGAADQAQYAMPVQGEDLTEQEAESVAKTIIMQAYNLSEDVLSTYHTEECSFIEFETGNPEWFVRFVGEDDATYQSNVYTVRMARDGSVIETSSPWLTCSLNDEYDRLVAERGMFVRWTVAQKFAYASELPRKIDMYVEQGGSTKDVSSYLHHLSSIQYGTPAKDELSEMDAYAIAESALKVHPDVSGTDLTDLSACPAFRVNEQGKRIWHWVFARLQRDSPDCGYFVDLDATTGEVLEVTHMIYNVDTNYWVDFYEY